MNQHFAISVSEVAYRQKVALWAAASTLFYIVPMAVFLILPFQLWAISELAHALKIRHVWVLLLISIIPLVGLVVILVLSNKATEVLRRNGIQVGLMGAKK